MAVAVCWGVLVGAADALDKSQLAAALDRTLDHDATARRTTVTLKVVDLETGEVLYDRGGDRLMTPASNLKIYTTAVALDTFDPEHRFRTRVVAAGPIRQGVLHGDLVLIGGGDPKLTSGQLLELVDRGVREWQLTRIQGRVRVDNSRYASPLKGPGWMWDDDPSEPTTCRSRR